MMSLFPFPKNASEKELLDFEIWSERSWIHWENIGEDLSVEGFFTFKGTHQKTKNVDV